MRPLTLAERLDLPASVSLTELLGGGRPNLAGETSVALTKAVGQAHLDPLRTASAIPSQMDGISDRRYPRSSEGSAWCE
jgi:hypothetical protein